MGACNGKEYQSLSAAEDIPHVSLSSDTGNGVALTLEGGGFRALTVYCGITTALLNLAKKDDIASLASSGLFSRFGSIASNSGGSWYACQLAYSKKFLAMLEKMAAEPKKAGATFDDVWIAAWLSFAQDDGFWVKEFAGLAKILFPRHPGLAQNIAEIGYFVTNTFTWQSFVNELMMRTADLPADTSIGSPVADWAHGKSWLIVNSLATPQGLSGTPVLAWDAGRCVCFPSCACCMNKASYSASASSDYPSFLPAKYSIVLGSGGDSNSAVPYTIPDQSPSAFVYTQNLQACPGFAQQNSSSSDAVDFSNLESQGGRVPLMSAVASSSAFLGEIDMYAFSTDLVGKLHGQFGIWHQKGEVEKAFVRAEEVLSQQNFAGLAPEQVALAMDGYIVDNTGIATAVQTGAREVVAFLDDSDSPTDLYALFADAGAPCFMETKNTMPVADGQFGLRMDVTQMNYAVFAQPADSSIQQKYAEFSELDVPADSKKFLKAVKYGTINVKTIANQYFGIAQGSDVTLHILNVSSSLNLGILENFHDYATLTQEIISTFLESETIVKQEITPWFFPK